MPRIVQRGSYELELKHGPFFLYDSSAITPFNKLFLAPKIARWGGGAMDPNLSLGPYLFLFFCDSCAIAPPHQSTFGVKSSSTGGGSDGPKLKLESKSFIYLFL
jgi:hypothetical protein